MDTVIKTMDDIAHSTQRIGTITTLINDIAFQTNIPALNAAVVAARAGEQGKGLPWLLARYAILPAAALMRRTIFVNSIDASATKVQSGPSRFTPQAVPWMTL